MNSESPIKLEENEKLLLSIRWNKGPIKSGIRIFIFLIAFYIGLSFIIQDNIQIHCLTINNIPFIIGFPVLIFIWLIGINYSKVQPNRGLYFTNRRYMRYSGKGYVLIKPKKKEIRYQEISFVTIQKDLRMVFIKKGFEDENFIQETNSFNLDYMDDDNINKLKKVKKIFINLPSKLEIITLPFKEKEFTERFDEIIKLLCEYGNLFKYPLFDSVYLNKSYI